MGDFFSESVRFSSGDFDLLSAAALEKVDLVDADLKRRYKQITGREFVSSSATQEDDDDEEEELTECFQHDKNEPIKGPVKVKYCPVTGFPFDFCEFHPRWEEVKKTVLPRYKQWYSHVPEEEFARLCLNDGGPDQGKEKEAVEETGGKKKKKEVVKEVQIRRVFRKGRKSVTLVAGLDFFGVKLAEATKLFRQKFSCGAAVVKGVPGEPDHIDVQGDFEREVEALIKQEYPSVPGDKIRIVD